MDLRKPDHCPRCGSVRLVPIRYGLPAPETRALAASGAVQLGGCVSTWESPDWTCRACGHEWFDPTDPARLLMFHRMEALLLSRPQ